MSLLALKISRFQLSGRIEWTTKRLDVVIKLAGDKHSEAGSHPKMEKRGRCPPEETVEQLVIAFDREYAELPYPWTRTHNICWALLRHYTSKFAAETRMSFGLEAAQEVSGGKWAQNDDGALRHCTRIHDLNAPRRSCYQGFSGQPSGNKTFEEQSACVSACSVARLMGNSKSL